MNKFLLSISILLSALCGKSQELSQVTFSGGATLSSFSFITDQKIVIRISTDGNIMEYGTDPGLGRYNYYTGKLQPYMGRVDYYGRDQYDSLLRGKVRSIGTCTLTYYGSTDTKEKIGKLKSIGSVALDYYTNYDNEGLRGKLKMAGSSLLDYYSSFENEAFKGKLKTLGNTSITYYSTFDDKLIKGKIKSIGSFAYAWYTSYDHREYQGAMKTGSATQMVNGVTYIVR